MKKQFILVLALAISAGAFSQNVGIGIATPNASAKLDITSTNSGLLIPRVALTAANAAGPVTAPATSLLVYNTATAGAGFNQVTPGFYYWNGTRWVRMANDAWLVGGNTLNATGNLGTISNNHVDLITNNVVRGRISNLGEFFIGTTATALPGDLMNGVSNATFNWAVNGYSSFDGSGVYGAVQGGTTIYAGVQGEYSGTGVGAGTRGLFASNTAGTGFNNTAAGVQGSEVGYTGQYKFGVQGSGGTDIRTGGVMGYDYGVAGALGYFASNFNDYAFYGFGGATAAGVAGGKFAMNEESGTNVNTSIGIGLGGGFMGGWIQGDIYGTVFSGDRFGMYVDGKTYVNEPVVQLVKSNTAVVPTYAATSMDAEVSDKGRASLQNGNCFVSFSDEFKLVMSADLDEMIVVVTPMGNTQGVYISSITANGFEVKENNSGTSSVNFNWMVTTKQKNTVEHSPEVISSNFENKLNGLMILDNDPNNQAQPIWWDGTTIRFDQPTVEKALNKPESLRPTQNNNQ